MPKRRKYLKVFKKGVLKAKKNRFESRSPILDTPEWKELFEFLSAKRNFSRDLLLELSKPTLDALEKKQKRPLFNFYSYIRKFMQDSGIPFERVRTVNERKIGKQYIQIFGVGKTTVGADTKSTHPSEVDARAS